MPYIAEGTYGCAFAPNIKCQDGKKAPKDAIGKIFSQPKHLKEERELTQKIVDIDPDGLFTVPFYGSCVTNMALADPSDKTHMCKHAQNLHVTTQLLYKNGGVDLKNLLRNFGSYKDLYIDDFIPMFLPLFKGVSKLIDNNLVHLDLKPENMLYNKESRRLYMIDFGLLTPLNKVYHKNYVLSWPYPYYPPEFAMYSSLDIELPQIMTNFDIYNVSQYIHFMKRYIDIEKETEAFVNKYKGKTKNFRELFNKVYVKKIDSYSLAMTFVEMVYYLNKNSMAHFRNKHMFDEFMTSVIIPLIRPDADIRMDTKQAFAKTTAILKKHEKSHSVPSPHKVPSPLKIKTPNIPSPSKDCRKLKREAIINLLKAQKKAVYGNKDKLCKRLIDNSKVKTAMTKTGLSKDECMKQKAKALQSLLVKHQKAKYGTKKVMCERLFKENQKKDKPKMVKRLPNIQTVSSVTNLTQTECEKQKGITIKALLSRYQKAKYGTKKVMCERLLSKTIKVRKPRAKKNEA
jgi:serine/threonine protein kinase